MLTKKQIEAIEAGLMEMLEYNLRAGHDTPKQYSEVKPLLKDLCGMALAYLSLKDIKKRKTDNRLLKDA